MNKVKNTPVMWVGLIAIVVVLGFCFYWFSFRPEQIKKECYRLSSPYYGGQNYEACLIKNGIE